MFMSIKLTDTQIVMLSAAAQRDDRCLLAPQNLKGSATQKLATKLIGAASPKRSRRSQELRCGGATSKAANPMR
jgi:hypothetical protein